MSGGSYSAYTGSTARTVPDLVVPGGVGAYPLVFSRTSTSRYVPGDEGDGGAFGPAGSWRHSYRWGFYPDNPGVTPAIIRIHYPDGRVIKFTAMSVAAPTANSPVPPADPYLRCVKPGVEDRLENLSGNGDYILHRHDGGRVYFQKQSDATYRVAWISDPHNLYTNFSYNTSGAYVGKLQYVTEPAGRWLRLDYTTTGGQAVISGATSSNGQSVTYNYTVLPSASGTNFVALTGVTYNSDPPNPANGWASQASYSYQPDNTGAGGRPLLLSCNDPHFTGPMPRIRYSFVQSSSVPYGQISAEIDDASGATVSSYNQSSLTETRGDGPNSYYAFNSYLITHQQDYDGDQTAFGYDANSYLSSVTNPNGHNTTITREPYVGKRTAISRPDSNGQLLTTTFDYGSTSQTPYPVQPYWVMSVTDPRLQKTTYTRDGNHQVTQISYPDGTYETFSYNGFGQVTYHRKTDSSAYAAAYDGSGNMTVSTDSANGSANRNTVYAYDTLGRLSQVTDFNGHNTWFAYNGRHALTQVKHDDGTHVDYAYDLYGNQTSVSDELQHVTTIAYDNHRRPTSVQVPVNAAANSFRATTFSYERGSDSTGNAHTHRGFGTVTLPSGKKVKRIYTDQGRLRSVTRGAGNTDSTTDTYYYDGLGNPLQVFDANNTKQAAYTYDALDRKSTLTDANGHVTTWNYYPAGSGAYAGWPQSKVAPGSAVGTTSTTNYNSYDVMGRLLNTTDASGQYSGSAYDANGRLAFVGDQNGAYGYGYDADSRVNSLSYPDGTTQTWSYDFVGNVVSYKNRNGDTKTITYDDRDRPTYASWSNNAASAQSWRYDDASRLAEQHNWYVALYYVYDDSGLPLSEAQYNVFTPGGATNTTTYGYDADGNVTSTGYPAGDQAPWTYDDQNRCIGLGTPNSVMWSHLYFQGERVSERALANNVTSEYLFYQANNRVGEIWHHHGGPDPTASSFPGSNISARRYGYAPDGQLTWADRQPDSNGSGSAWENGSGENYGYASNGALSAFGIADLSTFQSANSQGDSGAAANNLQGANGANGPGSYSSSYQYDASGNRSQVRQFGGSSFGYSADGENRYGGSIYDGNGCTTDSVIGWTYAYDAEGQMTSATRQSDGYNLQFAYDGVGRMIYQGGSAGAKVFCYAGAQRIEERNAANNASLYRYFFDSPHSDRITFRQQSNGQAYGGPRLFYQYDVAGNTTHVSDDGGNVVEQYLYDAYGTPYIYDRYGNYTGQTGAQDNRYLFHGSSAYQWLSAPGLYYCRARMYLPAHGRWLQPDPSGFKGGDLNLYRYCGNDPINCDDNSGLITSIALYPNHTLPGVGHLGIATSLDGLATGTFYAFGHANSILGGVIDNMDGYTSFPGQVEQNSSKPQEVATFNTTPAEEKIIHDYIQNLISNPGEYAVQPDLTDETANSCATMVYRALTKAGFKIKYSSIPTRLFRNINAALAGIRAKSNMTTSAGSESNNTGDYSSLTSLGGAPVVDGDPDQYVTLHGPGWQPGGDDVYVPAWQVPYFQIPDNSPANSGPSGGGNGGGTAPDSIANTGGDEEN